MNRRALLKMLPLAPVAMVLSPHVGQVEAEPIDTRPTYRLSDYWIYDPGTGHPCQAHGADHHAYTHGCQPAAFIRDQIVSHGSPGLRPATADAIPVEAWVGCTVNRHYPHQHTDFRWIA